MILQIVAMARLVSGIATKGIAQTDFALALLSFTIKSFIPIMGDF